MARDTALISRRVRSIAASLSLLLCLLAAMTADAADSTSREQGSTAPAPIFHRPSNEVERDLNAVLVLNAAGVLKDSRIFDFMTDRNGGRKIYEKQLGRYFSRHLLDAVAAFERNLVSKDCGGHYVEGDMCGFEYSPLTCAQDIPDDGYMFATEFRDSGATIITASWAMVGPALARYRMIRMSGTWIIDAIACPDGDRFNW